MRPVILVGLVTLVAADVTAQDRGAEIVRRYGEVIGGAPVLAMRSIRSTGTIEMPAMGMSGTMTTVNAAPNKLAVVIDFAGVGQIVQVFDGTHAWSIDPMQGPRLLTGAERGRLEDDAGIASILRRSAAITSTTVVGDTTLATGTCTWVKLVFRSGRESTECYDNASGLMAASKGTQESPMGSMATSGIMTDWKAFGPLKSATKITVQAAGQQQVFRVTALEFDRADDAALFVMPASIKALVGGQ